MEESNIRITKNPEERKKELIDIAEKLFIKNGYEQTAVSDIVKKAKVAQGTFYYYFKTKENILDSIIDRYINLTVEGMQKTLNLSDDALSKYNVMSTEISLAGDVSKKSVEELREEVEKLRKEMKKTTGEAARMAAELSKARTGGAISHTGGTTLPYTVSEEHGGFLPKVAKIPSFQNSGILSGFSSKDKHLASFRSGEAFIEPETVNHYGKGFFKDLILTKSSIIPIQIGRYDFVSL